MVAGMDTNDPTHLPIIWGRALRFLLVDHMMAAERPVSVAEMVDLIAGAGFTLGGRPSKVISDALRWEVRRGRVVRLRRGIYRYRSAPRSTARRIRIFAGWCHRWMDDVRRGRTPPPTPTDPRGRWARAGYELGADWPPWATTGWLWAM